VVVSPAGLPRIKDLCPAGTVVVSAEDLPRRGWFEVKPIQLRGRGLAPIAYQLSWAKKTLLFSGRIPIKVDQSVKLDVSEVKVLLKDFASGGGNRNDYAASLDLLLPLQPDLWLPAVPVDGQNANLYDTEWEEIIASNRAVLPGEGRS
jgi:hypothetical protein